MFLGPHKIKMSHFLSVFDTSGTWDFFDFRRPPSPLTLNFSQLKLDDPPATPYLDRFPSFPGF